MGQTHVEGVVTGPAGEPRTIQFLLDSGAKYTVLPLDDWQALGLTPIRRATFVLADRRHVDREISVCQIALLEGATRAPVILGEPGDAPVLGITTLEALGLVLHPFRRTVERAPLLLGAKRLGRRE